jgi:hypothetical protein
MRVGRFIKTPDERKQYTIDYTSWLAEGETIEAQVFEVTPVDGNLIVDGAITDVAKKLLSFFVSGGVDKAQYKIVARVTTSTGQIKEDFIRFSIDEV